MDCEIQLTLNKEFPCRVKPIGQLYNIFGQSAEPVPSSIFVYGDAATGKTSIVKRLLSLTAAHHAIINCIECYTSRLLLEPILDSLLGFKYIKEAGANKCDSLMVFVNQLKIAAHKGIFSEHHCVIVLDNCEYLTELGEYYLVAFSRLQELTSLKNLCVVFISQIVPEKFNPECSYINIPFPQYNKNELMEILILNKPEGYSEEFYKTYLNMFLSVFLGATRDLNELRHLAAVNFPKFCAPVDCGSVKPDDVSSLWRNIAPHLRTSLHNVYLGTNVGCEQDENVVTVQSNDIQARQFLALDLPYYAKYFLIAAYLASYNSQRDDKRLFVKNHGKQKKRVVQNKKNENTAYSLLGPKPFSLDRLLAIFYAIMEEKASLTANLLSQVSSLVELRLLIKLGDGLDKPKYKCNVGLDCVQTVARTLGFNIRKYLIE